MNKDYIHKAVPDFHLSDYIQTYTFINMPYAYASRMEFTVLPSSHTRMVLFLSEPSFQNISGSFQKIEANSLSGFYSKPQQFIPRQSLKQVIIQFTPWGIQPFLDFPLSDITNSRANLQDVFQSKIGRLCEMLYKTQNPVGMIQVLNSFFLKELSAKKSLDDRIKPIVTHILKERGNVNLKALSKNLYIGERTLQRLIHNAVGVNYKFFTKLVRLEYVSNLLGTNDINLCEVALKAGYFDQAHFNHEFNDVYGEKPSEFLEKQQKLVWNQVRTTDTDL